VATQLAWSLVRMVSPLTHAEIANLRDESHADDLDVSDDMTTWTREEVTAFFESGGTKRPSPTPSECSMEDYMPSKPGSDCMPSKPGSLWPSRELMVDWPQPRLSRSSHESMGWSESQSSGSLGSRPGTPPGGITQPDLPPSPELHPTPTWVMMRACREALALASSADPATQSKIAQELHRQGDTLFTQRRYREACAAYDTALQISPDAPDVSFAASLSHEAVNGGVWCCQLVPGQDIAVNPSSNAEALVFGAAATMKNLVYLIGDVHTRQCYAVDACWDVDGIAAVAARHRMTLVGSVVTHGHFDHAGGTVPQYLVALVYGPMAKGRFDGHRVPGLREMGREHGARLYCHALERELVASQCGLELHELTPLSHGSTLPLGAAGTLEILHTPGHSSGSICICATPYGGRAPFVLVGDTIFPGACGRLDMPDSDKSHIYDSFRVLRQLDDATIVYPGHAFSGKQTTIAQEKSHGLLRDFSKADWLRIHNDTPEDARDTRHAASKSPFFQVPEAHASSLPSRSRTE